MASVLIIDDSAEIRGFMRLMLEAEGHDVIEADNGTAALKAMEYQPEAIFVDVDMPQMTGVEFLVQLRQHPHFGQTPATFVTGHGDRVAIFAKAGIAERHVIHKPFKRTELLHALSRMLTGVKKRNLKVALYPDLLRVSADGERVGVALRLSVHELCVRLERPIQHGRKYTLAFAGIEVTAMCAGESRGLTRFFVTEKAKRPELLRVIAELLADERNHTAARKGERVHMTALVSWGRAGQVQNGFLRDVSASGAYLVSDVRPELHEQVVIHLPWRSKGDEAPVELRGCTAQVVRHGADGFGCAFVDPSTEFCIGLNALLSDGTVLAGEGRPVGEQP